MHYVKFSSVPTNLVAAAQIVSVIFFYTYINIYIYSSHQPIASVLFSCVSESFCFGGNKKLFCLRQEATCIMHSFTEAPSGINISTYSKKYTMHTCYVHCTSHPNVMIEMKTLKSSPRHIYRKLYHFCYEQFNSLD